MKVKHRWEKDRLVARLALLKAEKEHTRRGDELALMRQELPWLRAKFSVWYRTYRDHFVDVVGSSRAENSG